MNDEEMMKLMLRFRTAYGKADRRGLRNAITDDFEWHTHIGDVGSDCPTGRVLVGLDAVLKEIRWRKKNWRNVTYKNLLERPAGDVILQTFTTAGEYETGERFSVNVVDLYPVRDGRIYRKDTYWKGFWRGFR